jgi:hypothetical protein
MVGQLAALWTGVSCTEQSMLRHSSTEAFQVEVEGEMLAKFQEQAEQRLRLKNTGKRICDLILGSPDGQV